MRCARVDRLLEQFVDERLSERLMQELARHLQRCDRCANRLEEAHAVDAGLRGSDLVRAPESLSSRIMEEVYHEERLRRRQMGAARGEAPAYRRLGYSFVAAAALLGASLFIPRLAYPSLLHSDMLEASIGTGKPAAVAHLVRDAGQGFRAVVGRELDSENR